MTTIGAPCTAAGEAEAFIRDGGRHPEERARLDVAGAAWLVVAVVPLLVAISLGPAAPGLDDGGPAWGSGPILAMIAVSLVGLIAFLRIFVLDAAFLFTIIFLPLYPSMCSASRWPGPGRV